MAGVLLATIPSKARKANLVCNHARKTKESMHLSSNLKVPFPDLKSLIQSSTPTPSSTNILATFGLCPPENEPKNTDLWEFGFKKS